MYFVLVVPPESHRMEQSQVAMGWDRKNVPSPGYYFYDKNRIPN